MIRRSLLRAALTLGLLWGAIQLAPVPEALTRPPVDNVVVVDRSGVLPREHPDDHLYYTPVSYSEISPYLINASLSAEDARFWKHSGVDFLALSRAIADWIKLGRPVSGASTITQQLIKISHPRPRTLWSKCKEALQAFLLEQKWNKQQILLAYLNRVDYGNNRVGCGEASRYYFGKRPQELNPAEAAFLAGLPQAPSRLNPYVHFNAAKKRQEWILKRMLENGFLRQDQYERSRNEPIRLKPAQSAFVIHDC